MPFAALLPLLLLAQASQPPAGQKQLQQAETQQEQPAPSPEPIPVTVSGTLTLVNPSPPETPPRQDTQTQNDGSEGWGSVSDQIIAALTAVLAVIAGLQIAVMRRANKHFQVKERAYLSIIDGEDRLVINLELGLDMGQQCFAAFNVTNKGNTPARITDTFFDIWATGKPLPNPPSYNRSSQKTVRGMRAFLVKDSTMVVRMKNTIQNEDILNIRSGAITAWIYGYVDYIDAFNVKHRSGYARRIKRTGTRRVKDAGTKMAKDQEIHRLEFDKASDVYNYDRLRLRSEGTDWKDE